MTYISHLRRKWARQGVHADLDHLTHEGPKQQRLRQRIIAACDADQVKPRLRQMTVAEAMQVQPW